VFNLAVSSEGTEKRITTLLDEKIRKKTEQVFPDGIKSILANINLMRRATDPKNLNPDVTETAYVGAIFLLFSRNRELIHFSTVCLLHGGYSSVKVLVRAAYEGGLYMRLFNKMPNLAGEWFKDTEKFRKKWGIDTAQQELFQKGSRLYKSHRKLYGELCKYAHPSSEGWREQRYGSKVLWRPWFKAENAEESIGLIFYVIVQTWLAFLATIEKQIGKDFLPEIYTRLQNNGGMLARHFVVYTKTEDIIPSQEPEKAKSSMKNWPLTTSRTS
jgi:hypothetical protein